MFTQAPAQLPARGIIPAHASGPPTRPGPGATPVSANEPAATSHDGQRCTLAGAQLCPPMPPSRYAVAFVVDRGQTVAHGKAAGEEEP
jgi:hypothetical protein